MENVRPRSLSTPDPAATHQSQRQQRQSLSPRTAFHAQRSSTSHKRPYQPPPTPHGIFTSDTNLLPKRQRFDPVSSTNPSSQFNRDGRKEMHVAPDWDGNETSFADSQISSQHSTFSTNGAQKSPPQAQSRYVTSSNTLSLSHPRYGLAREIVEGFAAAGISRMYPWQKDCLSVPGLLTGEKNIVYTAPTSAGKSLVADLLMIRNVVGRRKKAIVVLPYIAIVQEKAKFLKRVLEKVVVETKSERRWERRGWRGINITACHSGSRGKVGWGDLDIAICTIEKANALINSAIEGNTIDQLGLVVFDELHMLDDPCRGYILELLATKLLVLADEIQLVGMSATLSNVNEIANWLRAEFYECTFRPIPLQEFMVFDNGIYNYDEALTEKIPISKPKELKDPVTNAIVTLAFQAVKEGHGALVFCESRRKCEDLSQILVKFMPSVSEEIMGGRMDVVRDLATTATGLDLVLEKAIIAGVAYHHAGLTTEERDLIAEAYDQGLVKVICCTATMAAGVNLPARRVILSPRMGRGLLSPTMLRQIRGRAGRKGKDTHGESYIICRKDDLAAVRDLIKAEMPRVESCLTGETHGLKRALLEVISTGLATSTSSLDEYVRATLLYAITPNPDKALTPKVQSYLESLKSLALITYDSETGSFASTNLGKATVGAGLAPEDGIFLHNELSRALKNLNLASDLHIVYTFTPIQAAFSEVEIDWKHLRTEIERLSETDLSTASFVGVSPAFVNRMAQGGVLKEDTKENVEKARIYKRFYVCLMLRALINEQPVHTVASCFDVARGFVQSLAVTCKGFASMSAGFCRVMGWSGLVVLLEHYSYRLDLGVREELLELARLPWVKSWTARVFWERGLRSVEDVAAAGVEKVLEALEDARPKKIKIRKGEEGNLKARLRERARAVCKAAERIWDMEGGLDDLDVD